MRPLGSHELGLFAAGAKVAMLIALPITAFQLAWGPFSLSIYKQSDAARTYNSVLKAFTVGILAAVLALTAVAGPVIQILAGGRYDGAAIVVFALSLGLALEAVGWITSVGIGFSKRSHLSLYAYAVFLGVSVVSMLALLRLFGLPGVVWGALLGHMAKTTVESWLAQRAHPLPWAYGGVVRLGLVTLVLGLASQIVSWSSGAVSGSIVAGVGVLVVLSFGAAFVFDAEDRGMIRRAARRLRLRTLSAVSSSVGS